MSKELRQLLKKIDRRKVWLITERTKHGWLRYGATLPHKLYYSSIIPGKGRLSYVRSLQLLEEFKRDRLTVYKDTTIEETTCTWKKLQVTLKKLIK